MNAIIKITMELEQGNSISVSEGFILRHQSFIFLNAVYIGYAYLSWYGHL